MRFMFALDVMSRNKDGHFQWSDQIVAALNAMGDLSVDETSSTKEILEAVTRLDDDSKKVLLSMKVSFTDEFKELMKEEDSAMNKESQKLFYTFTFLVVSAAAWLVFNSDAAGIESETLHKFMDFGLEIIKILTTLGASS